jgi:hypothetical protein
MKKNEIKTIEVDESYSVSADNFKIKPYLSINELNDIIIKMEGYVDRSGKNVEKQISYTYVEQLLIKTVLIMKYCTNIDFEGMGLDNDVKIYDFCIKNNFIDLVCENIVNYYEIEDAIIKDRSAYNVSEKFMDYLNDALNKFDINKIVESMNDAKKTVSELESKKVVKVARKKKE